MLELVGLVAVAGVALWLVADKAIPHTHKYAAVAAAVLVWVGHFVTTL